MSWLTQHWGAFTGWLLAICAASWMAVREWRLKRQLTKEQRATTAARAERDTAIRRACDAEAEARATRAQVDALEKLNKEAKDGSTSDLTDAIHKLNHPGG